jgi:hypothetical protein
MPVTTKEKRGRLEDAYSLSAGLAEPTSLRAYLRQQEQLARSRLNGGSVISVSGNGHQVEFAGYGPGQLTTLEVAELYRSLIDDFDNSFLFLSKCASYGLDPFNMEFTTFPNTPPPANPVNPAVLIDDTGRFADQCKMFGIDSTKVIGQTINDISVFVWLMFHLVPCTEAMSDYSGMRIETGSQFV